MFHVTVRMPNGCVLRGRFFAKDARPTINKFNIDIAVNAEQMMPFPQLIIALRKLLFQSRSNMAAVILSELLGLKTISSLSLFKKC